MPPLSKRTTIESASDPSESPPSHPPYRGVRRRAWGRYVSEIRLPRKNTRVWLGSFSSAESAARAHDTASFFLHGDQATLNFPELAGFLPRPQSSSPTAIRAAAVEAASSATQGRVSLSQDESAQFLEWVEECFSFDDTEDHVQL
ncbi:hypothetical protein J5N97_000549 [Dioscorea zingiberensis]|uniref:AP2/ERF domain-containing protein n=1 Tax=Dioscorea zingiberensis TaxID=325984 RepID=A0A9D5H192_9LILI|nr:hypothetical protein J5N97_000549 [Dioscorea zingiberensis]